MWKMKILIEDNWNNLDYTRLTISYLIIFLLYGIHIAALKLLECVKYKITQVHSFNLSYISPYYCTPAAFPPSYQFFQLSHKIGKYSTIGSSVNILHVQKCKTYGWSLRELAHLKYHRRVTDWLNSSQIFRYEQIMSSQCNKKLFMLVQKITGFLVSRKLK